MARQSDQLFRFSLLAKELTVLYMVVEKFKNQNPVPVYRRFRDQGRLAPDGLRYVASWVDEDLECCFQLRETTERNLLDKWREAWSDLTIFEVYPVISSAEAFERVSPNL